MRTWLKYVLFCDYLIGFVPQTIEFGVKFKFLLKIYAITWKDGLNTSYVVAIRWVLFPSYLSLMSNSNFLLEIYANYMKRWLKYVLFGSHKMCFSFPLCIK